MTQNETIFEELGLSEKPKRVLIADDELLVAQGIMNNLVGAGYEIIGPYKNGQDAVEACKKEKPDIALLDIQMPVMDGLSAAHRIFHELNIPVVMLTAYSDSTYLENSKSAGIFGFLLKPVSKEQLCAGLLISWQRFLEHVKQQSQIVDLEQKLTDRKIIEKAKWIIVHRKKITEPEAMKMLQKQSRNSRKSLVAVARAVIDSDGLL